MFVTTMKVCPDCDGAIYHQYRKMWCKDCKRELKEEDLKTVLSPVQYVPSWLTHQK